MQDRVAGLRMALDNFESGKPAQTEVICRQLLDQEPDDQAALLLLGLAVAAQGNAEGGRSLLIQLVL